MPRFAICLVPSMLAGTAVQAHPGHLTEVAGHGHWLGAAAIGAAIAIGLWGVARGRKSAEVSDDAEDATPDEAQET